MSSSSHQGGYEPDIIGRHTLEQRYEFLRELGRGGMAAVHLARQREGGALVAVKAVCARYTNDEECLDRFAREADILANVEHPNIVRTLAVETVGGLPVAIVMEYMRGETLRQALRVGGRLSIHRAWAILRDIAHALEHAHSKGVIHRDVKPENIFLDEQTGLARLADFGIARPLEDDLDLTISGMSLGTPAYMSPEQIDGAPLDRHSDIYSLGVVGWEMLTGTRPWDGETLYGILYRQKHENLLPLSRARPDAPPALRHAVEGALHKRTGARWATAREFLEALAGQRVAPSPRAMSSASAVLADEATLRYRRASRTDDASADVPDTHDNALSAAAAPSWHRSGPRGDKPSDPFIPSDPPWDIPTLGESREVETPSIKQPGLTPLLLAAAAVVLVAAGLAERRSADATAAGAEVVTVSVSGAVESARDRALPDVDASVARAVFPPRSRLDSLAACEIGTRDHQEVCYAMLVAAADARVDRVFGEFLDAREVSARRGGEGQTDEELRQLWVEHRAWRMERDVECSTRHGSLEGELWARDRARCVTALAAERATALNRARGRR